MNGDPGLAYAFALHLDGEAVARFQSIEGLSAHIDPIAYREGGIGSVRHLPGAARPRRCHAACHAKPHTAPRPPAGLRGGGYCEGRPRRHDRLAGK